MTVAVGVAPWAVIAGGGTGGHVLPALAVGRALVAEGHAASEVLFVGSQRGLEARLVPEAGFPVLLLPGRGIQRRLSVDNVGAVWGLLRAVVRAQVLFARRRPSVVVSVGGYASVPCALAAVVWRVPIVLVEPNARAGAANRLVSRFARSSAVQFAGTGLRNEVVTGNPVRAEVSAIGAAPDRAGLRREAKARMGVDPERTLVLVSGGSLGARRLNDATVEALDAWSDRSDLAVHLVAGARDHERVAAAVVDWRERHPGAALAVRVVPYEDDMPTALAAADVAVWRAGASVAELAAAALPGVLIPYPAASEDHQTINAQAVVSAGGGVLLRDADADGTRLAAALAPLLDDPSTREAMGRAALRSARADAAELIAAIVEQHAASSRGARGAR